MNTKEIKDIDTKKLEITQSPDPWHKILLSWLQFLCTIATVIFAGFTVFKTVSKVINNSNKQTQVVIEPREGDIIVKDGDSYKLLQLITIDDITFPSKVQEIQLNSNESHSTRVDINKPNDEDWSDRDSFQYVINNFSINPNKVINLLNNIADITIYCDFYTEQNISTLVEFNNDDDAFKFDMQDVNNPEVFELSKTNVKSKNEYVTKEVNDGFEWVKIRVEIIYNIDNRQLSDTLTSEWIATDSDLI